MKKFISGISALAMLMALAPMSAFADTTITENDTLPKNAESSVEFSVDPAYTVTIPQKIVLEKDEQNGGYSKSDQVTATSVFLHEGEKIVVTLTSASGFKMSHEGGGTYKLPYKAAIGTTEIASGDTIAEFDTSTTEQNVEITFTADEPQYAGKYSDTVVFGVSIKIPN